MEIEYYYNKQNECFIFVEKHTHRCQLHGDVISEGLYGKKIRTSGKPSNVLYYTSLDNLHIHSKDRYLNRS